MAPHGRGPRAPGRALGRGAGGRAEAQLPRFCGLARETCERNGGTSIDILTPKLDRT